MNTKTGIAMWDARFNTPDYVYGTEPNAFLVAQSHRLQPGMRALALADGEGRNGVWLAQQGLDVLSVDGSETALAKARALAAARGVTLETEQADLAHWDFGQQHFDLVAAIFIQFAGPELRQRLFAAMRDSLKPDGLLILQGYRPEQLDYGTGGPKQIEQLYTTAMLREAFAGMEILHLEEHDSVISEGCGHSGMSALVDLVARKPALETDQ